MLFKSLLSYHVWLLLFLNRSWWWIGLLTVRVFHNYISGSFSPNSFGHYWWCLLDLLYLLLNVLFFLALFLLTGIIWFLFRILLVWNVLFLNLSSVSARWKYVLRIFRQNTTAAMINTGNKSSQLSCMFLFLLLFFLLSNLLLLNFLERLTSFVIFLINDLTGFIFRELL